MVEPLTLADIPRPPLFEPVRPDGRGAVQVTEVGGEEARVAALFSDRELATEFCSAAAGHGMEALAGTHPRELPDWTAVGRFARSGADYVLVVSRKGAGLFHAGDVAAEAAEREGEIPLPLYVISDQEGEAPLVTVEVEEGEVLVAPLFSDPGAARAFRERAPHLGLPDQLGTIEDRDGLRRHALVARNAGAAYAVIDPAPGPTDALPIGDLIQP